MWDFFLYFCSTFLKPYRQVTDMKKHLFSLVTLLVTVASGLSAQSSGYPEFAQGYDDCFGGDLAHVVVMQHVTKEKIDMFIADLIEELPQGIPGAPAPSHQNATEKTLRDGQLLIRQDNQTYNANGVQVK